ncbi:MAG TPA: hypothetical protein VLM85_26560, partial [Polyangiaceae bacterium]|nr:hypothetical protein [Polyangiaceae bacterium]
MSELLVVPTERHVEIAAASGARAETRRTLRERLARAVLVDARFATDVVRRLALAEALPDVLAAERIRVRGPAAIQRTVDAVDEALRTLREVGVDAAALGELEARVPRARLLRRAMNALDERL